MEFSFYFQVEHLQRALTAARQSLDHPQELLGSVGESLLRVNRQRHRSGLAPDGTKWKKLAPLTLLEGKRVGGPLNKTNEMLQSFQYQVDANRLRLFFDGDRNQRLANIHNAGSKPYTIRPVRAKALKFGGMFRKRVHHPGIPKRQLIGFPISDQQLVGDVTHDYLKVILNRVR